MTNLKNLLNQKQTLENQLTDLNKQIFEAQAIDKFGINLDSKKTLTLNKNSMKYKLNNTTTTINGKTLYQIEALKDFDGIFKGIAGGFVESETNLSQEGNCWIFGGVKIYGDASLSGNLKIAGQSQICGDVKIDDERQETKVLGFFNEIINEQNKVIFQDTCLKKGIDY